MIRQIPKKGDPMVRAQLSTTVLQMLKEISKRNKRRTQDQFVKILTETFKDKDKFEPLFEKLLIDIKEEYQVESDEKTNKF